MPRVAPTLYEFVGADDGEYLKVMEAVLRIFNRQDELRANRARARIKVLIDRIGIDAFRELVEEELRGDWVAERDFDPAPLLFLHDEEAGAPALRDDYAAAPTGDAREFERFVAPTRAPQRQEGFVTVEVKVTRGDLDARAAARPRRRSCASTPAATRARRSSRTCVLRWVRPRVAVRGLARARRARPGRRRPAHDRRRRQLPGHRQLQARHHQLDGAERRDPGARRGDRRSRTR